MKRGPSQKTKKSRGRQVKRWEMLKRKFKERKGRPNQKTKSFTRAPSQKVREVKKKKKKRKQKGNPVRRHTVSQGRPVKRWKK